MQITIYLTLMYLLHEYKVIKGTAFITLGTRCLLNYIDCLKIQYNFSLTKRCYQTSQRGWLKPQVLSPFPFIFCLHH